MCLLKPSESINLTEALRNFEKSIDFVVFCQSSIDCKPIPLNYFVLRTSLSLSLSKDTLPARARNKEESLLWNNKFQVTGSERLLRFSYAVTIFLSVPRSRFKLCVNACETPEETEEKRERERGSEQDTIGRRRERREREREFVLRLISAYKLPFA